MISEILIQTSAAIMMLLGAIHLFHTFRGDRLHPREAALTASMQQVSPAISAQTTMWRAWVGFNASHSIGLLLFGMFYGYLATTQVPLLSGSVFLQVLGLFALGAYLVLAKRFWFRIPLTTIGLALSLYAGGLLIWWL